jgi:hypothetical protein
VSGVPPYPVVPVPSTYEDGPLLVAQLRSDLTNGVLFLANRPSFTGYSTSAPTITSGSYQSVVLDTDQSDPWAGHAPLGSDPQNWYCQAPGWYLAQGYAPYQYSGTVSAHEFGVAIGATTGGAFSTYQGQLHVTSSGQNPGVFGADLIHLANAGTIGSSADYAQLMAHTSGSAIAMEGASPNNPRLSVRWAGTGSASSLSVPSNAAFPVPPGYVGPDWLNVNVKETLEFLENPPMLRRTHVPTPDDFASTTWPAGVVLGLTGASLDNYGAWSGTEWVAPQPGAHFIYGQVAAGVTSGVNAFATGIAVNGTVTWLAAVLSATGPSDLVITGGAGKFRLDEGDTVQLVGYQGTGGPVTAEDETKLVIAWDSS